MKKSLIIRAILFFLVSSFLTIGLIKTIQAADFDFEKAHQDYVFVLDEHKKAHDQYSLARNAFLKSPSLKLQTQAEEKTLAMLRLRDEVIKAYLTALRMRVVEIEGLTKDEKESLYSQIDPEVAWYLDHQAVYSDSDSLTDLTNKSDQSQSRYQTSTEKLIYQILFNLAQADTTTIRTEQETVLEQLKTKVEEIKANGDKQTTIIERWFSDIEQRINLTKQGQEEARVEIAELNTDYKKKPVVYSRAIAVLETAFAPLKEVNSFLNEIIVEIKTAD